MKRSNSTLANPVESLVGALQNQQDTISILIKAFQKNGIQNKMVETKHSEVELSGAKQKKKTNYDFFISALNKIGKPATTHDIAAGLKKLDYKFKKMASKNKKGFMQFIYSAAYTLSDSGVINKNKFNDKSFQYSLPSWKKGMAAA